MVNQIFKTAYLTGSNGTKPINSLVDTGATYTVVSPDIFEKVGLISTNKFGIIEITACRETIKVRKIIIPEIEIDGFSSENVEAYISDTGFDVLIGLDTINRLGFLKKTGKLNIEY